jgi:undecaprenyl phosphate N,N'-diacetylbacillosamine 1-phosphate transferase
MIYRSVIKPSLDFIVALILILILLPLMMLIALVLLLTQKGKVLFIQRRPGYKEQIFPLVKFKTMNDKRDSYGQLLPDMQRMHATGRFLRKTSLDELPQLFNILTGDMSFVGPRPLLNQYLPLYNDYQRKRHHVKPGITGWAQINGRNTLSWQEKFELDVWYVEHQSFSIDMKILIKTAGKIFNSADVNSAGGETMPTFTGND